MTKKTDENATNCEAAVSCAVGATSASKAASKNPDAANRDERIQALRERIEARIRDEFGISLKKATLEQVYRAVALCVRDDAAGLWSQGREGWQESGKKCMVYLSAEYLMGRAFTNNLINLGVYQDYAAALEQMGIAIDEIEEQELDAGLGNGGLGRLAACFLDSMATLEMPAIGFGIRYEYGFFRQQIIDGEQREIPDMWNPQNDPWEVPRTDRVFAVRFGGQVEECWNEEGRLKVIYHGAQTVFAQAYDMPIVGYDSALPVTLRLWQAKSPDQFDLQRFNAGDYAGAVADRELAESISKVLYPDDSHEAGRELRLRQFYFLVSATMQSIVASHKRRFGDLHSLPEKTAIQINDTHPALAIPELIRILIDEEDFTWEEAVDIAERTFNYTNHTVMPEALEKWSAATMQRLLPRLYRIIETIDAKYRERIWQRYPGDAERVARMSIIHGGKVHMADLCVLVCGHVNGVSQLHGKILRTSLFRDFYAAYPDKFLGVTNGVTQRRWLGVANPRLAALVDDTVGAGFMKDWRKIAALEQHVQDEEFRSAYAQVKEQNKRDFAEWMRRSRGVEVNPRTIFDVHAKRIHEYKRQLMKALHILSLYDDIVDGRCPISELPATTFIFAGKAAPGYYRAKEIIRLINAISQLVASNPATRDRIPVVFLENYDVTAAEHLMPASDISEQISTAGTEASGTGNMKFMLNGALTLGTMDGSNVEISEQVGDEHIFIFGARVDEIEAMKASGSYNPQATAQANPKLWRALNHLVDGSLPTADGSRFDDLYNALVNQGDQYFLLYDFASYDERFHEVMRAYLDRDRWLTSAIINTAKAGYFSSDRAIEDYDREIWHMREAIAED